MATDQNEPSSKALSLRRANMPAAESRNSPFPKAGTKVAADATVTLLGCYPNGKPSDPKTYITAVTSVLAQYPPEIVQKITDPRTGIARRCKFMPSISELVEACDFEMRPYWQNWREEQQIRERERLLEAPRSPGIVDRFKDLLASLMDYNRKPDPLRQPMHDKGEPRRTPHGSRVAEDLARKAVTRETSEEAA